MKNITLMLIIILTTLSCKTSKTDFTKNLESITFYDFFENKMSTADIKNQWNQRIQNDEQLNAEIQSLEIKNILDAGTKKEKLMLVAYTNKKSTKTATKLTRFRKGFKLSNLTVTCDNCSEDLNPGLSHGDWICFGGGIKNNSCTKTSILKTE
jgi:hypothetical protein